MAQLRVFVFSDLLPWERACVLPVVEGLEKTHQVEVILVTDFHKRYFRSHREKTPSWILSHRWSTAAEFLGVSYARGPVFASVLSASAPERSLMSLLYRNLKPQVPPQLKLLGHSSLSSRFYREIEGLPETQVFQLPLPVPDFQETQTKERREFTVGTMAKFSSENGLSFLASLAHYVCHKDSSIRFRVFGSGPLYGHLNELSAKLGLQNQLFFVETSEWQDISLLDVLVYAPQRTDHAIPMLLAGAAGVPALAFEGIGVDGWIRDGHNGFLFPLHETKSMGEMVLRLKADENLRVALGQRLKADSLKSYGIAAILPQYEATFFSPEYRTKHFRRAA